MKWNQIFSLQNNLTNIKIIFFTKYAELEELKIIMLSQPKFAYHSTLTKESQKFDTIETLDDLKDQGKTFDELRDIRKSFDNYKQIVGSGNKFAVSKLKNSKQLFNFFFYLIILTSKLIILIMEEINYVYFHTK